MTVVQSVERQFGESHVSKSLSVSENDITKNIAN